MSELTHEKSNINDLTTGSISKKLIIYFLPLAAGTIIQQLYNAVDAIIVGKYVGTQALAAVGGSPANLTNLVIGFFVALTAGATVIIAQLCGMGDDDQLSKASHTVTIASVIAGIILSITGVLTARGILVLMQTPADVIDDSTLYLQIYFAGAVLLLVYNTGAGILSAAGDSRRPFVYLIISCGCNIVLDIVFVIVFKLGVMGVAIATVISELISTVLILARLFTTKDAYGLSFSKMHFSGSQFANMMKLGIPSGFQHFAFGITNVVIQVCINSLGTTVMAAWSLSDKVDGFYWATMTAVGTAVRNFIGQNYGAGRFDRVRQGVKASFKVFILMTLVLSAVLYAYSQDILKIFTEDTELIAYTWQIISFFAPLYFSWAIIEVISGALKGMGDVNIPVLINLVGIVAIRILWVIFIFPITGTLRNICLSYPASWIVTIAALVIYYMIKSRKEEF